jgi:hypothetical protein
MVAAAALGDDRNPHWHLQHPFPVRRLNHNRQPQPKPDQVCGTASKKIGGIPLAEH